MLDQLASRYCVALLGEATLLVEDEKFSFVYPTPKYISKARQVSHKSCANVYGWGRNLGIFLICVTRSSSQTIMLYLLQVKFF